MPRRSRLVARPRLEFLEDRLVLSTLAPSQIDSAYGLGAVKFASGTIAGDGRGQTIAIIDAYADPSIYSDLMAFDARNGLMNPSLGTALPAVLNVNGGRPALDVVNFAGSSTDAGWNEEEALDVEMVHEAAPAANIVLVEAKSSGLFDFFSAIKAVETLPSVSVISMSWGGPEFQGMQAFDSNFTTPVGHTGITFLASSGDDGAGVEWPASSPNVVGVGGTSLVAGSTGSRISEAAWSGSGGGISQVESKPAYQKQAVPGTMRSSPDVALDADPSTGMVIFSRGSSFGIGGTSMSAPIFAGLIAIADQGLELSKGKTLDGPTQTLPDLYTAPSGSFYDVTAGPRATIGYDTSTGLGAPNAATLIPFLDGVSGTTTKAGGGGTTTKVSIQVNVPAVPTKPSMVGLASLVPATTEIPASTSGPADLALVPDLALASATDAALDAWDLAGSVPSSKGTIRTSASFKPRG